jgi:hypothetical protein
MTLPTCHSGRRAATEMSELDGPRAAGRPWLSGLMRVARHLQSSAFVVPVLVLAAAVSGAGGCVIPPDLQQQSDEVTTNAPPVVRSVIDESGQEYPSPGPKAFIRGQGDARVTAYDVDPGDTLYVQFFVDYAADEPTPSRSPLCRAAPPAQPIMEGELERSITCDLRGLCTAADIGRVRFLEVEVYDREPRSGDQLLFRDVPAPGERSARAYLMTCTEPTPS